jgi:hypothetical protein
VIYSSAAFTKEIAANYQKIKFSGVGAKWQNGVAENAIKILVSKARTMMIYALLMWPEAKDETLWPMAVSHAAYLYNHTPNEVTGIAPIEIFTQTTSDGQALKKLIHGDVQLMYLGRSQNSKVAAEIKTRTVRWSVTSPCREHFLNQEPDHRIHFPPISYCF